MENLEKGWKIRFGQSKCKRDWVAKHYIAKTHVLRVFFFLRESLYYYMENLGEFFFLFLRKPILLYVEFRKEEVGRIQTPTIGEKL